MAGAGYRDWVPGEKPTAAQFDNYLQEQTVMVFASAAARDSALSAVKSEGMLAFLLDANTMTVYSGSAWSTVGPVHGAWTSWTPTVTQSGSVTVTVSGAGYSRVGRTVTGSAFLQVTGSGTGSNAIVLSLPVNASSTWLTNGIIGAGFVYDQSSTNKYRTIVAVGASAGQARMFDTSGTFDGYIGSGSTAFTAGLASGDIISFNFTYEAAADA